MVDAARTSTGTAVAVTAGGVIALVGTFLPWLRSGTVERTSYEVFDLVDRVGFSPDGPVGWALRMWPLVPMLIVLSVVGQWWAWRHPALRATRFGLPVVTACYAGGTAIAIRSAPETGLFRIGGGPSTTIAGCAAILLGLAVPPLLSRSVTGARLAQPDAG